MWQGECLALQPLILAALLFLNYINLWCQRGEKMNQPWDFIGIPCPWLCQNVQGFWSTSGYDKLATHNEENRELQIKRSQVKNIGSELQAFLVSWRPEFGLFEGSLWVLFPKVLEQCECGRGCSAPGRCHCQRWERHTCRNKWIYSQHRMKIGNILTLWFLIVFTDYGPEHFKSAALSKLFIEQGLISWFLTWPCLCHGHFSWAQETWGSTKLNATIGDKERSWNKPWKGSEMSDIHI